MDSLKILVSFYFFISAIVVLAFGFCGCTKTDETSLPAPTIRYGFEQSDEGWMAGFSDYPAEWDPEVFEFDFNHVPLPDEIGLSSMSLVLAGSNLSDDLFMFLKKQISGLKANHTYSVSFQIEIASQYPEASVGIGGSPGSSVFIKAGGATEEPKPIEIDGYIRMNIDKGNQSQGGDAMQVLGHIGIPGEEFEYQLVYRDNLNQPIEISTDQEGRLWVVVGTDSGFEGTTELFYNSITIHLGE